MDQLPLLIVGEVFVDYTLGTSRTSPKMRLGGVVHAARGLWAADLPYAVAAVCPAYLVQQAKDFLSAHGCSSFVWLGDVERAPNVVVIGDAREVGHQGYEDLLRDERTVSLNDVGEDLKPFTRVAIYPGHFELTSIAGLLNRDAAIIMDVAYDVRSFDELAPFKGGLKAVVISTSSELFLQHARNNVSGLQKAVAELDVEVLLLKENRGGSRLFPSKDGPTLEIPATLSETANSVGVGDAYTAVFAALSYRGWEEAAYRGAQVATNYAATTYPDDLKAGVRRDFKLSLDAVRSLGGTSVPWHERPDHEIYLAAPDFTYIRKEEVDAAVAALQYHNFRVRRPVQENGEVERNASKSKLYE